MSCKWDADNVPVDVPIGWANLRRTVEPSSFSGKCSTFVELPSQNALDEQWSLHVFLEESGTESGTEGGTERAEWEGGTERARVGGRQRIMETVAAALTPPSSAEATERTNSCLHLGPVGVQ